MKVLNFALGGALVASVACSPSFDRTTDNHENAFLHKFLIFPDKPLPRTTKFNVSGPHASCTFAPTIQEWNNGKREWELPCSSGSGKAWFTETPNSVVRHYQLTDGTITREEFFRDS